MSGYYCQQLGGVNRITFDTQTVPCDSRRMGTKKVKVALFLEPAVARELKVRAAQEDAKGLSVYIAKLLRDTRRKT